MSAAKPLLRATFSSNNHNDNSPIHRIRLVPHLDSLRALRFDPITCDLRDGDTPICIGRFTDQSDTSKLAFNSKVVSRAHAEIWSDNGKFYIKDAKSSSGTFLNRLRLSPAGSESKPHQLKDGDIVQLGVDYQGNGTDDNYKSVKMRIEVQRISSSRESRDHVGKVRLWSIGNRLLGQRMAEGRIKDSEEAQRHSTLSDTQLHCYNNNGEPNYDHTSRINHPSETTEVLTTVWDACIYGDLPTIEELLTQQINKDGGGDDSYAVRSLVKARQLEWDSALQDAVKSITIQPSLWGYISKGIALCGNQQLWDAMEAFDLAFIFTEGDLNPMTTDLLLLIKAVALFNASRHDEAMRRVQDLTIAYQHLDTLPCSVVNSYLCAQLAIIAFENGQYNEAADQLTASMITITDLFSLHTPLDPRLDIFELLFGWDFDSIQHTISQKRCDAFLRADRLQEAAESLQYLMSMLDESDKDKYLEWSMAFKQNCIERCVTKADEAVAADNYEMAFGLYSAAIKLDSSSHLLFAYRGKAKLGRNLYAEALRDADTVIELNPSSCLGYELKYAALQGEQRHDEAIEVITTMLSKLDNAPNAHIQKLHQEFLRSEAVDAIQRAIHTHLENAPLRLLNITTGRVCDREAQIHAFMESTEYKELLYSWMTHARIQTGPIQNAVAKYFSWVMLSHRWEIKELQLHDIKDKVIYDLDAVGATVKLQMFCKTARDAGYCWACSYDCLSIGRSALGEVRCTSNQCLEHTRMDHSGIPCS